MAGNSERLGVSKAKMLIGSMKLNWNFQRGGGCKVKTIHVEGMDIFWNHTFCDLSRC